MERGNSSSFSEGDRISHLPDSLIHHILSFMDIKLAVQTSVLSKKWRYIWTSLPVLQFDDMYHYYFLSLSSSVDMDEELEESSERFTKFVNNVLNLHDDSSIQRFHLQNDMCRMTVRDTYRWIAAAVSRNVQELIIKSRTEPEDYFEIPPCLCTCTSLTKLELKLWGREGKDKIILPHEMSLPRLKSLRLSLEDIWFHDEKLANKFFSSFPSLESLIMEIGDTYYGSRDMNLNISLPELKYFKFDTDNCEFNVKLCAPSLVSFSLSSLSSCMSSSFSLENLSSLVTADIAVYIGSEDLSEDRSEIRVEAKEYYAQWIMGLLRGIHNVEVLTLNGYLLKALGGAPAKLDTQLPEFYNLQHLKLDTYLSRDCLRSIFCILKNSPNIESVSMCSTQRRLDFALKYPYGDEIKFDPENIGGYWDAGFSLSCMICDLKSVEIEGLEGFVNELKFLEILLKHATAMEKVILHTSQMFYLEKGRKKRIKKFGELLLKFPTASKKILILEHTDEEMQLKFPTDS